MSRLRPEMKSALVEHDIYVRPVDTKIWRYLSIRQWPTATLLSSTGLLLLVEKSPAHPSLRKACK